MELNSHSVISFSLILLAVLKISHSVILSIYGIFLDFLLKRVIFRAIFDLSNKIALLILLRMFALYVEKQKIEN